MKKNKQHRSLTFTFLRWLALFSITVLVLLVAVYIAMTAWIKQLFRKPDISDLLRYQQQLYSEDSHRLFAWLRFCHTE